MRDILQEMDKAFDSRVRIGIMSVVMAEGTIDFNALKKILGVTDGNLASHTASLEIKQYIQIHKKFIGKRPNTTYSATPLGKVAFRRHVVALQKILMAKSFH